MVAQHLDATTVGSTFARLVGNQPGVRELWVRDTPGQLELFLLVDPVDANAERHLYGISAVLQEQFPDLRFQLFVRNPADFIEGHDLHCDLPKGAQRIPLGG